MTSSAFHPALTQLLRLRALARLRRLRRRLTTRRRLLLSALGLILASLWLGNAVASILFRQSADPALLRRWVPLGFCLYGLWHVVRVAYRRPEQPIEWSPGEQEILEGAPLTRRQLLSYHVTRVFSAATFKAGCFALLMLPDFRLPLAGFLGALAALLFLELCRLNVDIIAWGVSRTTYRQLRVGILSGVVAAAVSALAIAFSTPIADQDSSWPASLLLLKHLAVSAAQLEHTAIGRLICAPFHLFSEIILAEQYSGLFVWQLAVGLLLITVLTGLTLIVDEYFQRQVVRRERWLYGRRKENEEEAKAPAATRSTLAMLRWRRADVAMIWRQFIGVRHYAVSLSIALSAPMALSLLPLVVYRDPIVSYLNVTAGLAFYSLLLLPAALRFDFRRDVDRMALLKSFPVTPRIMVLGQLATPVLIATVFQLSVLTLAWLLRPVHPSYLVAGWLLLIPMNVLVFALDNLIFLLYPYRPNQEGLEIFLRTTLTFTAKGLLFALALVITAAWALLAGHLVHGFATGNQATVGTRLLFAVGLGIMLAAAASVLVQCNIQAFRRFDASQDTPG